ncbi:MAG: DUF3572 family protein [Sphingomonadales bacterium]|nr:MAG: DUF3572 family protein [Sphingomonadales bacterium]TNF02594.1 MAG: DUF3572 family protein [Sphingomonadales bacterium]
MRFPDKNGNGASSAATQEEAPIIALRALAWIMGDEDRAHRMLALTGLDAGQLRDRAADPEIGMATLDFLGAHEPDLIACAEALDLPPERLMQAAQELGR